MQLWTPEHAKTLIPTTVVMLALAILLRVLLKNKSERIRIIPLQTIAVLLVLIEIGKQVTSFVRGYDLYHLPFHFCSLFIFMVPLAAFYCGRGKEKVRGITAAISGACTLLLMIYPSLIYSAWDIQNFFKDYLAFHTVAFHNLVILVFFCFLTLDLHKPAFKREYKATALFMIGFSVVAATMSQLLKTNYANMYECNIPPLESLREMLQGVLGYAATQVLYVMIVMSLHIGFVLMSYGVYKVLKALVERSARP